MNGDGGLASVIIPTYYRNEQLREAIQSAQEQEYEPIEIIVVDDSGERNAAPVCESLNDVTYLPLPENRGENPARTAGLEAASGEYIQFLDDDDYLYPDKIRKQVRVLSDSVGVVYCGCDCNGKTLLPEPSVRGDVLQHILEYEMWPPCFTSSLLIDRSILEEIPPLKGHGSGFDSLMMDLAQLTKVDYVDEALVSKGDDPNSLGASMDCVRDRKQTIEQKSDLYDQFPPAVRRKPLAETKKMEGEILLQRKDWSISAIVAYFWAAYYSETKARHVPLFLGSIFGTKGIKAINHCIRATEKLNQGWESGLSKSLRQKIP